MSDLIRPIEMGRIDDRLTVTMPPDALLVFDYRTCELIESWWVGEPVFVVREGRAFADVSVRRETL